MQPNVERGSASAASFTSTALRVLALALSFLAGSASLGQQTAVRPKAESPNKAVRKGPNIYVPATDLSRSSTDDVVHTTYRLAAGSSPTLPVMVGADGVDVSVLKNILTAYGVPANGGSGAVAVVVAYDHRTAAADLQEFSEVFGLPHCASGSCLEVLPPQGSTPPGGDLCTWEVESATSLQWAHALAPNAKLVLAEAETSQPADMFAAVQKATNRVLTLGGGQVILPWGSREGEDQGDINAAMEKQYDQAFSDGVVYFAASGDQAQLVAFPAASAKVVSVGGTIPTFDQTGELTIEIGWPLSGGGHSQFVGKPAFQKEGRIRPPNTGS